MKLSTDFIMQSKFLMLGIYLHLFLDHIQYFKTEPRPTNTTIKTDSVYMLVCVIDIVLHALLVSPCVYVCVHRHAIL